MFVENVFLLLVALTVVLAVLVIGAAISDAVVKWRKK